MALPTSIRLPDDLNEALDERARDSSSTKSALITGALREWLITQAHPRIHFVTTTTGERRAALLAGPQVWTVAEAWLQHDRPARTVENLIEATGLAGPDVEAALAYWAVHQAEIDQIVERHWRDQDQALSAWERRQALKDL
ncbi:MAG: ribbon-helix-helix domain-containing protein [Bifidobacteriaceae bacterium]|nr:ribbon-helix-helix domain-containing protein [Bifidobacteriaceae bacterium]